MFLSQALVAHTCNPSYSGGRGLQFKTGPRKIALETLPQKKKNHKKELVEWFKV
jgi:hypothetical protein